MGIWVGFRFGPELGFWVEREEESSGSGSEAAWRGCGCAIWGVVSKSGEEEMVVMAS